MDLSNFDTSKVYYSQYAFYNCNKLETIYVSDNYTTSGMNYYDNLFYNCSKLVGGEGTTFDPNHIKKEYAHIDGGQSNPGYFTRK